MGPFLTLLVLGLVMGVASFAAGCVPLLLSLNESRIRQISSLGIGILVGTSMIVIIPEGVETLYTANTSGNSRKCVGISLVLGFLLMYCIDKLPGVISSLRGNSSSAPEGVYMANLDRTGQVAQGDVQDDPLDQIATEFEIEPPKAVAVAEGGEKSTSTMIGLVIHAFADGIALGASVSSGSGALELIVFIAIMIHKAPASFGLATVLMRDNLSARRVRLNLFIFAAAAPLGALLTWLLIKLMGSDDHQLIEWWTGNLLIFSGGTFLFVAVHVMQELNDHQSSHGSSTGSTQVEDLALSMVGMVLPLLTMLIPNVD